MKYLIIALTFFTLAANAQQSVLNKEINTVKKSVVELNQELYQLEQELLSTKGTEVAFYFSLRGGKFFVPLSLELSAEGLASVHHVYTEREVNALRQGAIHPVGKSNIGTGKHLINVQVRGVDQHGDPVTLAFESEVEKTSDPLMLEISIQDNSKAKKANAQLVVW